LRYHGALKSFYFFPFPSGVRCPSCYGRFQVTINLISEWWKYAVRYCFPPPPPSSFQTSSSTPPQLPPHGKARLSFFLPNFPPTKHFPHSDPPLAMFASCQLQLCHLFSVRFFFCRSPQPLLPSHPFAIFPSLTGSP